MGPLFPLRLLPKLPIIISNHKYQVRDENSFTIKSSDEISLIIGRNSLIKVVNPTSPASAGNTSSKVALDNKKFKL
jgi:hypothetical protein